MLEKIKNAWGELKFALVALALFVTYFIGRKRGKQDEKAQNDKAILENISRSNLVRRRLDDPAVARRVRKKYTRK